MTFQTQKQFIAKCIEEAGMSGLFKNHDDFFDVEPVWIELGGVVWVHPAIEDICSFEDNNPNEGHWAHDVHRVYFKNEKRKTLTVIVKSKFLDAIFENFDTLNETQRDNATDHLASLIEVCLIEDTWVVDGEQFCFTRFGKKVSKFFDSDAVID